MSADNRGTTASENPSEVTLLTSGARQVRDDGPVFVSKLEAPAQTTVNRYWMTSRESNVKVLDNSVKGSSNWTTSKLPQRDRAL